MNDVPGAWCKAKQCKLTQSARVNAWRAWKTGAAILTYRKMLEERGHKLREKSEPESKPETPPKHVDMTIEPGTGEVKARDTTAIVEAARMSREESDRWLIEATLAGPDNVIDWDAKSPNYLQIKPEFRPVVQSYKRKTRTFGEAVEIEIEVRLVDKVRCQALYRQSVAYDVPEKQVDDKKDRLKSVCNQLIESGNFPPDSPEYQAARQASEQLKLEYAGTR